MKHIRSLFQFTHQAPFNSIKLRLPLSYAAIAFLVALSLGGVLMGILSQYYSQQEVNYLQENARAISVSLGQTLNSEAAPEDLQLQVNLFALLSRTDLTLVDSAGQQLVQSEPQVAVINLEQPGLRFITDGTSDLVTGIGYDTTLPDATAEVHAEATPAGEDQIFWVTGVKKDNGTYSVLPQDATVYVNRGSGLYGFGLTQISTATSTSLRSSQIVAQPVLDANGQLLATVFLSDGPAYGTEIIRSVAKGWVLASVISITLAVFVGYLASRNVSIPLEKLTQVTKKMASGDLSIRTDLRRSDEIGLLAQAFNDMAHQVEATVSALQHFVSDAAHEVNTPITALRTNLEIINPHNLPAQDRVTLQRALGQVKRLEDLTRNLLRLSRLESGIRHERPAVFDLVMTIREAVGAFASRADQANIDLKFDAEEKHISCLGYADHLRVAFENLVDNALKFTPSGGQVAVTVQVQSRMTRIVFQDTGIGIPNEHLLSIFDRFHRAPNASSFDGNGLGLAIVKEIVERHRGTITAHNTNPGTSVSIILP